MPRLDHRFSSRIDADLAAEYLAEQGISAYVSSGDLGGVVPSMQVVDGVSLEVATEYVEAANAALLDFQSDEPGQVEPLSSRDRVQSWVVGVSLLVVLGAFFFYAVRNGPSTNRPEPQPNRESPW